MSTDREMLELAARAGGYELIFDHAAQSFRRVADGNVPWNSRDNSADALELAVKLKLLVDVGSWKTEATNGDMSVIAMHGSDPLAATRLAITRAAASIQLAKIAGEDRHE